MVDGVQVKGHRESEEGVGRSRRKPSRGENHPERTNVPLFVFFDVGAEQAVVRRLATAHSWVHSKGRVRHYASEGKLREGGWD